MRLIPLPKRRAAKAGLLAGVLAATALYADSIPGTVGHVQVSAVNVEQRKVGTMGMSRKTVVNLGDVAAVDWQATQPYRAHSTARTIPATVTPAASPATGAATPRLASRLPNAAEILTPSIDANFDGMAQVDPTFPPDPNAAAGLTQVVEVVNTRLTVQTRTGQLDRCGAHTLNQFFGSPQGEQLTDPRVIYDNVANKFTVIASVDKQAPAGAGPALPGFPIIRIAHSMTGDACGGWTAYYLSSISLNGNDIAAGTFVDQPSIGQDRDAFLFGGLNANASTKQAIKYVAFSEPKSCAYTDKFCSFTIFSPDYYATPASSAGNPMITTMSSYFVASVPDVGYKLYRMDNSGNATLTTLTLQATVGLAPEVQRLTRGASQPGPETIFDLRRAELSDTSTRITSTPYFDGTRIWYTHTTSVSNHAVVRYGAINTATNTDISSLALHSPTSDDFNSSIAVGLSGTSRTIFLNWAYVDAEAGVPLSDAVAEIRVDAADPLPVINGSTKHLTLIKGGVTSQVVVGDYSSVSIDPVNLNQVCAVTAQEYFNVNSGSWATRISRFGAPGC